MNDRRQANEIQVGGKHYQSGYQHWDFVKDMGLDYLEGCATKYVTRRKSDRFQDLNKALHFLHKAREGTAGQRMIDDAWRVQLFCIANKLKVREMLILECILKRAYDAAIKNIEELIEEEK